MTYEIEHGVEVPESQRGRQLKYPWPEMEPGDSFFMEDADSGEGASAQRCAVARRF